MNAEEKDGNVHPLCERFCRRVAFVVIKAEEESVRRYKKKIRSTWSRGFFVFVFKVFKVLFCAKEDNCHHGRCRRGRVEDDDDDEKKELLLRLIASSRKDDTIETREKKREILESVSALEKEASMSRRRMMTTMDANDDDAKKSSIEGRWSLVYSTSDDENTAMFVGLDDDAKNDKIVKDILDALYAFFFAFAAPFAGGFAGSETYKKKGRGGDVFIKSIRNEQIVDLKKGRVENVVDIEILGRETRVAVRGEIKPLDKNQEKVQVTFTDWSFGDAVTLPLPRPTGGLENTYCDETMRISRGSRGGVFITTRIGRDTPQK